MELQRAADSNNMKGFYSGLKKVWGRKKKGPVQLKSADGMETFSDNKRVVARWSVHFQKLLNVPGDIDHEALDNIPQSIIKRSLDDIPTMDEMAKAIAGLKDGKAPGGDGIPMPRRWVLYHKHGRMPALLPSTRKVIEQTVRNLSSLHSRQALRQDPTQQTTYPHNTRGSSRDTMWLQR